MLLKKILALLAISSFSGCLKVTPCTINIPDEKAECIPTDTSKPEVDIPLPAQLEKLNKFTCFSPDDFAEIMRKLNQCH